MTRHLFAFAFGQVQSFIEAARTTRDLWKGSELFSALAQVAATELLRIDTAAELIFPAADALASVANAATQPTAWARHAGTQARASGLPNKLIAVIHLDDPRGGVERLRGAVHRHLLTTAQALLAALDQDAAPGLRQGIDEPRLQGQLPQLIETSAAWVPWPEATDYCTALKSLQRLLDARKRTRPFAQTADDVAGAAAPLSSFDGRRESVLMPPPHSDAFRQRFHISAHEELDAAALIKRLSSQAQGFPSVVRVALQPWVAGLSAAQGAAIGQPLQELVRLKAGATRYRVPLAFDLVRPNAPVERVPNPLRRLHFDGELLLAQRRAELRRKAPPAEVNAALVELEAALRGAPLPTEDGLYVALLMADGDRMGDLLNALLQARHGQESGAAKADHRNISQALAAYAGRTPAWLAQHGGVALYAGGDDVLALCPVNTALAAARQLADAFAGNVRDAIAAELQAAVPTPSMSVGIAFAHVMHPLLDLRRLAAKALKLAKQGHDDKGLRNALGVVIAPRGGTEVAVAGRWNEAWAANSGKPQAADTGEANTAAPQGFDARLALWQSMFAQGLLAHSAGYDLAALAVNNPLGALRAEAPRLIQRRLGTSIPPECLPALQYLLQDDASAPGDHTHHRRLANEWYASRWLHMHQVATGAAVPAGTPAAAEVSYD